MKSNRARGVCLEELEGRPNVVKATFLPRRTPVHDADRWIWDLHWMVDGIGESDYMALVEYDALVASRRFHVGEFRLEAMCVTSP